MERTNENFPKLIKPDTTATLRGFLEMHERYPIIAVTGPSGVGKTTITNMIALELGGEIFTEQPDYNNYLKVIRETSGKVSDLVTWYGNQMFFLTTDVNEMVKAIILSNEKPIVFDFALSQTFIYSDMNLKDSYLKSFKDSYFLHFNSIPKPDIVIEVGASDSVIVDRLEGRGKYIDDLVIHDVFRNNTYFKNGIVSDMYDKYSKVLYFNNNENLSGKNELLGKVLSFMDKKSIH